MILNQYILLSISLLAACAHAERNRVSSLSTRRRQRQNDVLPENYRFVPPKPAAGALPSAVDDLELLDIVILASVDGKLHGMDRTTGRVLWTMAEDPTAAQPSPTTFDSLVRTEHSPHDNADADQELFIIEPQSGAIYVLSPLASPSDPLQRLPFSMPQLVEMSPFSFPGDEHRMFVGRKETSMLVVELDTGKVKGTVNADKECFWADEPRAVEEIDLDELDGTKPPKNQLHSPEIHIGRTDYHVRVHLRHQGVVQDLHYSSYGPNNIDKDKQAQWKRTPDGRYIQPLSNGHILAFQPEGEHDGTRDGMPIWAREFRHPIVAIFDVLTTSARSNPLALLQPRPHLEHLFPRRASAANTRAAHTLPEVTYVGLVGDSLYAMGHENFPLVVFDQEPPRRAVDADAGGAVHSETGGAVDSGAGGAVDSGAGGAVCRGRQCLVGSRRLEASEQWYIPPLLDGVPDVPGLVHSERVLLGGAGAGSGKGDDAEANTNTNDSRTGAGAVRGERWTYTEAGVGTWGVLGGAILVLLVLARTVFGRRKAHVLVSTQLPPPEMEVEKLGAEVVEVPPPSPRPSPSPPVLELAAAEDVSPAPPTPTPKVQREAPYPTPPLEASGELEDGDESEKEGAPRRKGPRRRKRGKKKRGENAGLGDGDAAGLGVDEEGLLTEVKDVAEVAVVPVTPTLPAHVPPSSSLLVSDTVLGFGSHGTVVYEGSLQGRAVAVKRLLQDFVTIAAREVELLQESDDHPNVIRYFYKEAKDGFLYIALELCPASLADVVERPEAFAGIARVFDAKRALGQVAAGLRHLHTLKIVHRDIKPANILVSRVKSGQHRMLISDFGLCKKLEVDQTSFLPTVAAGTAGWRAPEILRGEVKLDEQPMDPDDLSSRGSTASAGSSGSRGSAQPTRLTKSVDVFALGCLFYYTLTGGAHPFGDRFEREVNILKGRMSLSGLEQFGEEGAEAAHLITRMLDQDAKARPDTTTCLTHPFFWTPARRLNFLQDASDRFEIMCRDPREPPLVALETGAHDVVGSDWHARLDRVFVENLGKFRKYDGRSVQDLMRALRNKKHHYQDLPDHVKRHLGPLPEGFLGYFTRRFPELFLHVYAVVWRCGLARESMFRSYFELADP